MAITFNLTTEELLPLFAWNGKCTVHEGPVGGPPTSTIRTNQPWHIHFEWEVTGGLNFIMAGKWKLRVYLEQMGGGEFTLPNPEKEVNFVPSPHNYRDVILFSANVVPAGVYRLVTTITMVGLGGQPGPISGVGDGGLLHFYEEAVLGP